MAKNFNSSGAPPPSSLDMSSSRELPARKRFYCWLLLRDAPDLDDIPPTATVLTIPGFAFGIGFSILVGFFVIICFGWPAP